MLGDPRKSFVGHPDATQFGTSSSRRVFQQPQANALIDLFRSICVFGKLPYNRLPGQLAFNHSGMGSAGGQVYEMPTTRPNGLFSVVFERETYSRQP